MNLKDTIGNIKDCVIELQQHARNSDAEILALKNRIKMRGETIDLLVGLVENLNSRSESTSDILSIINNELFNKNVISENRD